MIEFVDSDGVKFVVKFMHGLGLKDEKNRKERRYTICKIVDQTGLEYSKGIAYCSINDNFCRETGRKIALARALEPFDKPARSHAWYEYLTRKHIREYAKEA